MFKVDLPRYRKIQRAFWLLFIAQVLDRSPVVDLPKRQVPSQHISAQARSESPRTTLEDMNANPVVRIKISECARHDVSTLSIFKDIYRGKNFDLSGLSEAHKPSTKQNKIVRDHVTVENVFGCLWINPNLGEVVAKKGNVVELLGNVKGNGLNKIMGQDSGKVKREWQDIYPSVLGYYCFS